MYVDRGAGAAVQELDGEFGWYDAWDYWLRGRVKISQPRESRDTSHDSCTSTTDECRAIDSVVGTQRGIHSWLLTQYRMWWTQRR